MTLRARWTRVPASIGLAVSAVVLVLVAGAAPAAADPPGPTDYRTEVVAITPDLAGVEVDVIGGDSFVQLRVDPGVTVEVSGYRGEPYLRFEADGRVLENRRAPTRWLNLERYAGVELPAVADAEAEPVWDEVAGEGTYAWHDHRTHWMNEARPPGASPGDVILEAVVPLVVDGVVVEVRFRSVWEPGPSAGFAPIALAAAGLVAGAVFVRCRSLAAVTTVVGTSAVVATVLGTVAYRSVPAETGPSLLLWALPVIAVICTLAAWSRRGDPLMAWGLLAVAAVEVGVWGWIRREALVRAIVPTDAPVLLDRLAVATSLAVGTTALVFAGAMVAGRQRRTERAAS